MILKILDKSKRWMTNVEIAKQTRMMDKNNIKHVERMVRRGKIKVKRLCTLRIYYKSFNIKKEETHDGKN